MKQLKKMSLEIANSLSRDEMKKIMAGSGGPANCGGFGDKCEWFTCCAPWFCRTVGTEKWCGY